MIIYLGPTSPSASSDPPESEPGRFIAFYSVLLRMGFTWLSVLPQKRWSLTPPFHPYRRSKRSPAVYFCCTGLGVTSTGRYPASCPVKPGLSSPAPFRDLQPRSSALLTSQILTLSNMRTFVNFSACSCDCTVIITVHPQPSGGACQSSPPDFCCRTFSTPLPPDRCLSSPSMPQLFYSWKHPPPTNSLHRELVGTAAVSTPTK